MSLEHKATQALMGDYSRSLYQSTPTPVRTPLQEDVVLQEARNLRLLRDMTPLADNDTPLPDLELGTGFEGVLPRKATVATPNTLLGTGLTNSGGMPGGRTPGPTSVGGTPLLIGNGGRGVGSASSVAPSTSTATPLTLRDQLGLNDPMEFEQRDDSETASLSSYRSESRWNKEQQVELRGKLRGLPEPEYTYDISIPTVDPEEEGASQPMVEDAAEVEARQVRLMEEEAIAEERRRSSVLRRDLPRPLSVSASLTAPNVFTGVEADIDLNKLSEASVMINREMVSLVGHDLYKFPLLDTSNKSSGSKKGGAKIPKAVPVQLDEIGDGAVQLAREMVEKEVLRMTGGAGAGAGAGGVPEDMDEFVKVLEDSQRGVIFLPTRGPGGSFAAVTSASKAEVCTWV